MFFCKLYQLYSYVWGKLCMSRQSIICWTTLHRIFELIIKPYEIYKTSTYFLQMEIHLGSRSNNSNLKVVITTQKTATEQFRGWGRPQIHSFHCYNFNVLSRAQAAYPIKSSYWNQGISSTITFICRLMLAYIIREIGRVEYNSSKHIFLG